MSHTTKVLHRTLRRLLWVQGALVLIAALACGVGMGLETVPAALFGGAIALLNTAISAERLHRATAAAGQDARQGMAALYSGAIIRFVATPALIAVGILALGLDPVAILIGFGVAQLGYLVNHVQTGSDA